MYVLYKKVDYYLYKMKILDESKFIVIINLWVFVQNGLLMLG